MIARHDDTGPTLSRDFPGTAVSTFSFFTAFLSTFAPAALGTVIRDNLNLTGEELATAGITAVCGTIGARILMGQVCDLVGPRFGHAFLLLLTGESSYINGPPPHRVRQRAAPLMLMLSLTTCPWMALHITPCHSDESRRLPCRAAPAVFFTAIIDNATSYIFMRFLIGLSLATFVANQFWASQMFR